MNKDGCNMPVTIENTGLTQKITGSIISEAKRKGIKKLCLFGSRARGDHDEKSDIDLAVYGGNVDLFKMDIEETVPTLLMFDVVDMEKNTSNALREIVEKEGIVIYEET